MAKRPLVTLPSGHLVFEADVRRLHLRRRLRFVVELVVFTTLLVVLFWATTSVTP